MLGTLLEIAESIVATLKESLRLPLLTPACHLALVMEVWAVSMQLRRERVCVCDYCGSQQCCAVTSLQKAVLLV